MPTAASHPLTHGQCDQPGLTARSIAAAKSVVRTLQLWRTRINERHRFPILDERDLRDLRLSRWDVERELAEAVLARLNCRPQDKTRLP